MFCSSSYSISAALLTHSDMPDPERSQTIFACGGGAEHSAMAWLVVSARCPRRRERWAVAHVQMQQQPQPVCHAQSSVLPPGQAGGRCLLRRRSGAGTATSWRATAGGAKGAAPTHGRRRFLPRLPPPSPPAAPRAAAALAAAAAAAAACAGRRPPAGRDPSGRPRREKCPRPHTRRSRRAPGRGRATRPALRGPRLGAPPPCQSISDRERTVSDFTPPLRARKDR